METPTRKTPGIRARELYESGTIDGAQYEAIVSADRRFQKEEARWQAEVEAHYGAAPPAADWTLCGGGTVDAAYPPGPPPLMVPVAVQENAYVSGKGWKHGCEAFRRRKKQTEKNTELPPQARPTTRRTPTSSPCPWRRSAGPTPRPRRARARTDREARHDARLAGLWRAGARERLRPRHEPALPGPRAAPLARAARARRARGRELFLKDRLHITRDLYGILKDKARAAMRRAEREAPDDDGDEGARYESVAFHGREITARIHRPKAVHWEELTEVGAALSPRTRRPTDRFYQREAPRPKVRRLERADTEPLEEVRGLAARADEGRASPHEGDDLEGDDLAPPPEGADLPPADEGEDSAAEEFDRKSAPRFSPAAAARLQEALEVAQAESSLAAPPGRWFEPGQEARKILLGTRVRGIEYEGAHLNVDALSRARVLVLEEEAAISSTVDDPLRLNDARLQPGILCEKYDWTKIDDESDVAIVVECTGAVDFFLLALSVSGSVSSATRCKGASLQTADFRAAKLIAKLNHFSVEDLLEKFREHAPRQERSRHRVSDGSMYCFGMRCDARDGNTFSSYSAKEDLKADQAALVAIAYQNKMLGDIEALLLPPVGDARKRHLALADENLKQYGKRAMMIEDNPGGLDGSASPAHAFTRGYGVQLHQEMSSSLPETISWPGGQDAARELADGALCFAILDAGVLLDVGESAKGSGRVCIIPGDTWHATLRCLDDSGRYHKVVGTSLLSKNNLLPAEDD
ncbi:hypothetical protein SO694_00006443 [Aureococcus anophagefferens]|uniref:Uncharacterized protein n=1 Tax=Aureococcus anophagefferens TaxID=44056 RepID=A0ABR1GAP0_AURAN